MIYASHPAFLVINCLLDFSKYLTFSFTSLFKRVPFHDLKCFRWWWWSQRRRRMVSLKLNKCCKSHFFRIYQPSYIIIILGEQAMYIGMLIIGFLLLLHLQKHFKFDQMRNILYKLSNSTQCSKWSKYFYLKVWIFVQHPKIVE